MSELRCWNIEHLSLLPVRSLPLSSTTILSTRKWLGLRSHRNQWPSQKKKNTSPGVQCNFSCTERHCQRRIRLCHRTYPNDSVQFDRILNKNLRKLSLLNSIGFCLRKIKDIFFPSCLIYTHSYKTSKASLLALWKAAAALFQKSPLKVNILALYKQLDLIRNAVQYSHFVFGITMLMVAIIQGELWYLFKRKKKKTLQLYSWMNFFLLAENEKWL